MTLLFLWCKKKGVTLVEILIAFIILTMTAFGAMGLISHGSKMTRHDFRRDEAIQILVDRMNRLSALPFNTLRTSLGKSSSFTIMGTYNDIQFGDNIRVGNNTYQIKAILKRQDITFSNLMEIDFSPTVVPKYESNKPYTWSFRDRKPSSTISYSDTDYQIIKIHVQVTPKNGPVGQEKTFEAVTFVCNMEN